MKNMLDKNMIQKAIDDALDRVLKIQDTIEQSDDIIDSYETVKNQIMSENPIVKDVNDNQMPNTVLDQPSCNNGDCSCLNETPVVETPSIVDTNISMEVSPTPINVDNTSEKVNSKVEEVIEEEKYPEYNFLGLDIKINKVDGKYEVKIIKDDKEKVECIDSIELPCILGLVESFFNELVLDDSVNIEDDDTEINLEDFEKDVDTEDADTEDADTEDVDAEDEKDEDEKAALSNLRMVYASEIDKYFEHGLLAKQVTLEMVKEKITAKNVKELVSKNKEKDRIIASKYKEIEYATKRYVLAMKVNKEYQKVFSLISSSLKTLHDDLTEDKISKAIAEKAINKYKSLISNILNANNLKTIKASTSNIEKVNSVLLAHKKEKENQKTLVASKQTNTKPIISKKENEIKNKINVSSSKNIMNSSGWNDNRTIMSGTRYDGIDEMSSEIMRIAGVDLD